MRRRTGGVIRGVLVLGILVGLVGGCAEKKVEKGDCNAAADRTLALMGKGLAYGTSPKEGETQGLAWAKRVVQKTPLRKQILEVCEKTMTAEDVDCVLAAKDDVALALCYHQKVDVPTKKR